MAVRTTGLGWHWASAGRRNPRTYRDRVLVGMNLPLQQNFIAIAVPAVIGMIAVLLINHTLSIHAS